MGTAVGRIPRQGGVGALARFSAPLVKRMRDGAALRARLHLASGERMLLRVGRPHSPTVVATERALYWYPSIAGWIRLGWDEIDTLYEDQVTASLVVARLSDYRAQPAVLPVRSNVRLREFAQERITASRIIRTQLTIDGHELRVEGRRLLGTDQHQLRWFVLVAPDLDPKDPALQVKVEHALADLRATLGV